MTVISYKVWVENLNCKPMHIVKQGISVKSFFLPWGAYFSCIKRPILKKFYLTEFPFKQQIKKNPLLRTYHEPKRFQVLCFVLHAVLHAWWRKVSSETTFRTWVLQQELIFLLGLPWLVYHIKLLIAFHTGLIIRYFTHIRINERMIFVENMHGCNLFWEFMYLILFISADVLVST